MDGTTPIHVSELITPVRGVVGWHYTHVPPACPTLRQGRSSLFPGQVGISKSAMLSRTSSTATSRAATYQARMGQMTAMGPKMATNGLYNPYSCPSISWVTACSIHVAVSGRMQPVTWGACILSPNGFGATDVISARARGSALKSRFPGTWQGSQVQKNGVDRGRRFIS